MRSASQTFLTLHMISDYYLATQFEIVNLNLKFCKKNNLDSKSYFQNNNNNKCKTQYEKFVKANIFFNKENIEIFDF